jgi:hypothetical protein
MIAKFNFRRIQIPLQRILSLDKNYFEEQFRYGHREILLNYSLRFNQTLQYNSILDGSIDHGWAPHENIWRIRRRNLKFANRYVWNEKRLENYSKNGKAVAVGAPWLYMLSDLGITKTNVSNKLPKKDNKIVLFPGHSDLSPGNIDITTQIEIMARYIPRNAEVTVCLYWVDYLNPILREKITSMNYQVFCAGFVSLIPYQDTSHAARPHFLLELYNLIKDAAIIITSEVATSTFYGMSLGSKICFTPIGTNESRFKNSNIEKISRANTYFFPSTEEWIENFIPEIYSTKDNPKTFMDFGWSELGINEFEDNSLGEKFVWKQANVQKKSLEAYKSRLCQLKIEI